jgi:hypothetical protein
MMVRRLAFAAALLSAACSFRPLVVDVMFTTGWTLDGQTLSEAEQATVTGETLATLRRAFDDFNVDFTLTSTPSGHRILRIEDTPSDPAGAALMVTAGAVGATHPLVLASTVRIDALLIAELAAVGCRGLAACTVMSRDALLRGLGRGIGATAAHELGHQVGLRFTADAPCDDCYDGPNANTRIHFFGDKRWSEQSLAGMRRALPAR